MKAEQEIQVTLSEELLDCLRSQARELHVPLKWLVAGLVCDTISRDDRVPVDRSSHAARHVA